MRTFCKWRSRMWSSLSVKELPKTTAGSLCTGTYSFLASALNRFLFLSDYWMFSSCYHLLWMTQGFGSGDISSLRLEAQVAVSANSKRVDASPNRLGLYLFWVNITVSPKPTWHVLNKGTVIFILRGLSCYFLNVCPVIFIEFERLFKNHYFLGNCKFYISEGGFFTELDNYLILLLLFKHSKFYCVVERNLY